MPGGRPRKKQRNASGLKQNFMSPPESIPGMSDKENLHVEGTHDRSPSPDRDWRDIFTRETEFLRIQCLRTRLSS